MAPCSRALVAAAAAAAAAVVTAASAATGVAAARGVAAMERRLAAAPWPRLSLNGDPAVPAAGSAVQAAGVGVAVDGGPPPADPRFVDQPTLTPDECVSWGRLRRSRGLPGWDWTRTLDHPAFLCAAVWAGGRLLPVLRRQRWASVPGGAGSGTRREADVRAGGGDEPKVYCCLPDFPSVAARLSSAKEWVDDVVGWDTGGGGGGRRPRHRMRLDGIESGGARA